MSEEGRRTLSILCIDFCCVINPVCQPGSLSAARRRWWSRWWRSAGGTPASAWPWWGLSSWSVKCCLGGPHLLPLRHRLPHRGDRQGAAQAGSPAAGGRCARTGPGGRSESWTSKYTFYICQLELDLENLGADFYTGAATIVVQFFFKFEEKIYKSVSSKDIEKYF